MKLLRVPARDLELGPFQLDTDASNYVLRVHRLGKGDSVVLFDPIAGKEATANLIGTQGRLAQCRVVDLRPATNVPKVPLVLIQAFAKGEKVDRVVKEATALGVSHLMIVDTERSVVQLDAEAVPLRRERWMRLMVETSRQCGRGNVPSIAGPLSFDGLLGDAASLPTERLLLSPSGVASLFAKLATMPPCPAAIFIGPEGGVSAVEEEALVCAGFCPVRFGDFILRTETASTAVLGAVLSWQRQ